MITHEEYVIYVTYRIDGKLRNYKIVGSDKIADFYKFNEAGVIAVVTSPEANEAVLRMAL